MSVNLEEPAKIQPEKTYSFTLDYHHNMVNYNQGLQLAKALIEQFGFTEEEVGAIRNYDQAMTTIKRLRLLFNISHDELTNHMMGFTEELKE